MSSIHGLPPPLIPTSYGDATLVQAVQFRQQIEAFSSQLRQMQQTPSLTEDPAFLSQLKGHIVALGETANQINEE